MLNIQRADAKQIRDIYVNSVGASSKAGGKFDNGTVSVMEVYAAQAGPDGALIKGADGNLVKGNLLKVFVMGKDAGWGDSVSAGLKNGAGYIRRSCPMARLQLPIRLLHAVPVI